MSRWSSNDPVANIGNQNSAQAIRNLVAAENKFLTSLLSLSKDAESVADAWRTFGDIEGGRLWQDAVQASTSLLTLYAGALEQHALKGYQAQPDLESIQAREENIVQHEEKSRMLRAELYSLEEHLQATQGWVHSHDSNRRAQLERRDDLNLNIAIVESTIELERKTLAADREAAMVKWMSSKFASLLECSEKGTIVGLFGQRIVQSTSYEHANSSPGALLDEAFNQWTQLKDTQLSAQRPPFRQPPAVPPRPSLIGQPPALPSRPPPRPVSRPATPLRVDVQARTPYPQPSIPAQRPANPTHSPVSSTLSPNVTGRRASFNRDRRSSNASSASDDLLSPFLPILGRRTSISGRPRAPSLAADYFETRAAPTMEDDPVPPPSSSAIEEEDVAEELPAVNVIPDPVKPAPPADGCDSGADISVSSDAKSSSQEASPGIPAPTEASTDLRPEQELSTPSESMVNASITGSVITAGGKVSIDIGRTCNVYNGIKDMDKEDLNFLNWVSKIDSKAVHWSILENVTPETGTWFLNSVPFDEWANSDKKLLWGVGKPGAGKTYLSSIIINNLEERAKKNPSTTVVYVHCRYSERFTTTQVFAALLRQLAENSKTVFANVKDKLYTPAIRCGRARVLTRKQILDALVAGLQAFSKTFVILDALDELKPEVRHDVVGILEKQFQTPILLTSRLTDLPHGRFPDFEIRARSEDLHAFVHHNIGGSGRLQTILSRRQDSESILNEVAEKIEEVSDGMFLLTALHAENLKEAATVEALLEAVDQLPKETIDGMYQTILEQVDDQSKEMKRLAYRAIGWVVYSVKPLTLQELVEALAVEPGCKHVDWNNSLVELDILIATCCGLLTFERATGTIRFIHVTVHHFFEERGGLLNEVFHPSPHSFMAEVCASYMKLVLGEDRLSQESLRTTFSTRAFLDHACRCVGSYINLTMPSTQEEHASGENDEIQILQYIPEPLRQLSSIPLLTSIENSNIDQGSLAHLGALSGISLLLRWKFSSPANVNEKSEEGMTPLFYAAIGGHISCLQQLLREKNIDVHHKAKNGTTALMTAALFDQKQAQAILLRDHQAR